MIVFKRFLIILTLIPFVISGCTPKLMNYEEFSKTKVELPKILTLKKGVKELLYIGSYHSNLPQDSLFVLIDKSLEDFNPDFIFHEGSSNWPIFSSRDSTIRISGEPGYIMRYAQQNKIPYATIEPDEKLEYNHLIKKFGKKDAVLMYICRQIDQQQRFHKSQPMSNADFEKNMNYFLSLLKQKNVQLTDQESDFNYWKAYYKTFFKEELDWKKFDPSNYYPNFFKNRLNQINRESDKFRNQQMVHHIFKALKEYNKVFVVVGGGHLIVQEKRIKYLFNKSKEK